MKTRACVVVLSLVAAALDAAVLWDGDASNGLGVWGSIQVPDGSVTVVDDATYGKAFKIVCNDNGGTKVRAEVARFRNYPLQDNADYYIGWSSKWGPLPTLSGKWQVLSQVHLDGPGSVGGPVPFGLSVPGDGQMHFNLQDPNGRSASMWNHSLPLNQWHRYVMRTKVSTSLSTGFCELWYDGVMQTLTNGQTRIPCAMDHADAGYYWKWGVYRSGSGGPIGQSVHYLARVRLASTLADALPAPPGTGPTPTPTATRTPTATPTPTSTPVPAYDVEVTPPGAAATASTHDGNLPANAVDNTLATRWSANGDGHWLKLDLGTFVTITRVGIAVYNGNARQNRFDIHVSEDNSVWSSVLDAGSSSGTTTLEESHDVADRRARWIRYYGHGSSDPTKPWMNSVTELSVFALPAIDTPTPTPTTTPVPTETPVPSPTATPTPVPSYVEVTPMGTAVTASTSDGNVPANTVDNNLATRWSANGDGQWLQLDLGAARTVGHVNVAVYNGSGRRNRFDLQISTTSGVWTTVWTGESSGTTTGEETYEFPDVSARWIRCVGHMSNVGTFNSVTEVSVFAVP